METLGDMFQEDVISAEISPGAFGGFPSCAGAAEHPCRERSLVTLSAASAALLQAGGQSARTPAVPPAFKGQQGLAASTESRAEDESLQ